MMTDINYHNYGSKFWQYRILVILCHIVKTDSTFVMGSDVNGVSITVPAIVLICVSAIVSVTIIFRLYQKKKTRYIPCTYMYTCMKTRLSLMSLSSNPPIIHRSCGENIFQTNVAYGIDITNPATETGTSTEFSLTNHTEHDSQDMAVDVVPNEAYGVTSANTQMPVCTIDKGCGESVYQTNVAYGITKPAMETSLSTESSLINHAEHDSQDMAVDVAPNEAYGVTSANTQMPLRTIDKGESLYSTNVAYGITKPAIETGTSTEFSRINHTEHDSQDMAVIVTLNEAYGVTSANTQMTVCTTDKGCGESVYQTNVAYGIIKPAIETGSSTEFSLINHMKHDSHDMAVDVAPNEAYGVTSANTQMPVCTIDKGCGESFYSTNVAYGITKPAIVTGTSTEFSLINHMEHDSQDMAVDVAPNEAYGVTSANTQIHVCGIGKGCGESVYQTNVAYGITKPAIETGTSAEFSLINHTGHDMAVDVAPNEAYGVTPAGAQMTVCTTDKRCSSKHKVCSSTLTNTSLHENDGTECYSYVQQPSSLHSILQ